MKRSFRGLATFLGGAAFVAFTCLAGPNCQPSGGDLGNGGDAQGGSGDGGSGSGGKASGGSGGNAQGGNGDGGSGSGGKASGGSGGSDSSGGKTSSGGSGSGGSGSGGKASGGSGGSGSGGSGSGGSNSGGTTSAGGASTAAGGATTSAGGAAGGSTGSVSCTTDLMTLRTGTDANWIPSTPQSCNIQGSVYSYSDGSSCTTPASSTVSACASGSTGCCIAGTTVVDSTYAKWGCGLGIDFNSSGGATATKSAYTGPAKGFKITLTGTVGGGQKVRIMYSSSATDPTGGTAPFKEVEGAGTYSILFSDATCPTWATGSKCTVVSGSAAYSVKIQLSGGGAATDPVGAFNICITALVPII